NYQKAKRNIEDSPFAQKIRILNKVVGSEPIWVPKEFVGTGQSISHDFAEKKKGYVKVGHEKLDGILDRSICGRVAVKIDCEGAEVGILKDTDLKGVYIMQIEYHGKESCLELTKIHKKQGFDVRVSEPQQISGFYFKEIGFIYATRK
ncbi:MAG: FkbM family methyltransferase, partial [Candidatus Micrarchaeota archaeon]|nr:FkbM family methyltransferase [Candidatus Micrarchaeota archaeon]